MKSKIILILLILFSLNLNALSKEKMVETVQEWEQKAQNIPLAERDIKNPVPPKSNKKHYYPSPKYTVEKYNYPQGQRELDLTFLKKRITIHPIIVADPNCEHVAYSIYHYSPDNDQISSELYIGNLDTKKTKKQRILDYSHANGNNYIVFQAGMFEKYPKLFRGLTLVDWSSDSNKILFKERVGSTVSGNYMTYLYVHFLDTKQTLKLEKLNKSLIDYFIDTEALALNKYKYDIEPLGFNADNDNIIMYHCVVYDNKGKKIFLGTWGYDLVNDKVLLYSKTDSACSVSANGLVLKRTLE